MRDRAPLPNFAISNTGGEFFDNTMDDVAYKVVDLFGNERVEFAAKHPTQQKSVFDDYEAFVAKFEVKKTTDDCYTPPEVYAAVLKYVATLADISTARIIRPFYSGGDYTAVPYDDSCIVIDNPPFSIITKICKWYESRGIRYFLFAPHLTLFSISADCTYIVTNADVKYENGAVIKTAFVTNLIEDVRVLSAPELAHAISKAQKSNNAKKIKYEFPENVLTVSMVARLAQNGIPFQVNKQQAHRVAALSSMKEAGKGIFGSGFLIGDDIARKKADAELLIAERAAAVRWELSAKEKAIISAL